MASHKKSLILLIVLTFAWFFLGIAATIFFSLSLNEYTRSGDSTTLLMLLSLLSIILLPIICAHTIIHGWRRFMASKYDEIVKVVLIPLPYMIIMFLLFKRAW